MKQYIASLITESALSKIDNMTFAIVIARHRPVGSCNFAGELSKVELSKNITHMRILIWIFTIVYLCRGDILVMF